MKLHDDDELGCASYLLHALYNRKENFDKAKAKLKDVEFDTVVCTGVSGMLFAPTIAMLMDKQIAVVRKSRKGTHSGNLVECNFPSEKIGKWIFVDDLIDTGKTRKRVKKALKDCDYHGTFVGEYLYEYHSFRPETK